MTTTYAYDDANEIGSITTAGVATSFGYDANGNRTSMVVPPSVDTAAPSVPASPSATATAFNRVTLTWTASSDNVGVTAYRIYRDSTLVGVVAGSVTSFADVTTTGSTTYSYTVAAVDAAGNASAQSSAAGATTPSGTPGTDTTAPSTPTALSGTPVGAGRIDLTWSASTDDVAVAGYNVYRDGVKLNSVPIGSTAYSDTALTAGVSHTYTVSAIDAAANESSGSSSWSGAATDGTVTTTYAYDTENRLTALSTAGQTIGSYAYDGSGDRIAKTAAGATTSYTLDLASSLPQVIAETKGSSTTTYAFAGSPLEIDQAGTTYWYQDDTLGSVRMLTDALGNSASSYNYSAFGATRTSSGSIANEVRFSGERTDTESGLEFLRARTYDPATGTFLQRDTWGITPTDSQSLDVYAYTENNPLNALDPSGHCALIIAGDCVAGEGSGRKSSGISSGAPTPTANPGPPPPDCPSSTGCPKAASRPDTNGDGRGLAMIAGAVSAADLVQLVHDLLKRGLDVTKQNLAKGYQRMGQWGPTDIAGTVAAETGTFSKTVRFLGLVGYGLQLYGVRQTYMHEGAGPALKEGGVDVLADAAGIGAGAACVMATGGLGSIGCIALGAGVGVGTGMLLSQLTADPLRGQLGGVLSPRMKP